jgi:hypothetical protein
MPHAWIENGAVRDVCHGIPTECYHPDIAKFYDTEVPPGTENGATLVDGEWVNPPPPVYVPQPDVPVVQVRTRADVLADLASIDMRSIRALREGNAARIAELEAQAVALRAELAAL